MGRTRLIQRDLEGDLLEVAEEGAIHYAKRLSLGTVWHSYVPTDLAEGMKALVSRVEQDWPNRLLLIHYQPRLRPLSAPKLRSLLPPGGPLTQWRLARLAADLCDCLGRLHTAGFPQLVVHPGRLALLDGGFALLPTLAGVLPPLSDLLPRDPEAWLPFLAPEVLRTRGKGSGLLAQGDVYALGRTLMALADPDWTQRLAADPHAAAERIVESPSAEPPFPWPDGFETIAGVVGRMCALRPEARPSAGELAATFHSLERRYDPQRAVQGLIDGRRLDDARSYLAALEAARDEAAFAFPQVMIHRLRAEIALAEPIPQYAAAVAELGRAKEYEPRNAEIYRRLGRVYLDFKEGPQRLQLADESYGHAARLSVWREEVIEEWLEALRQGPAENLLERTAQVPWERRSRALVAQRAASLLVTGDAQGAWSECVDHAAQFGFDPWVYEIAQQAAASLDPAALMVWMAHCHDLERMPALQSIVWARLGQPAQAAAWLAQALQGREGAG
jgi:hypothetical protein